MTTPSESMCEPQHCMLPATAVERRRRVSQRSPAPLKPSAYSAVILAGFLLNGLIAFLLPSIARPQTPTHGKPIAASGVPGLVSVDPADSFPQTGPAVRAPQPFATPCGAPIVGFADFHCHMFNDLGFGGLLLWGKPFDPTGDIASALPWCTPAHGPGGIDDLIGSALGDGFPGHHVGGFPQFDGWPTWRTATHQQVYYEWLHRAFQGGLKLLVMQCGNNQTFCELSNQRPGFGCNDMAAVDREIQAAKDLEKFIDNQNGGDGWFKIAYSGRQARQIINSGKMAVVLGAEVESIFDCFKNNTACDDSWISSQLEKYYDMGLRELFPIVHVDNRFGGTALYTDIFAFTNKDITGDYWRVTNCPDSIDFHLDLFDNLHFGLSAADIVGILSGLPAGVALLLQALIKAAGVLPDRPPPGANCNCRGLTAEGEFLINAMMDKGMLIDVDHMSARTLNRTLDIAESRKYPGLVMGHTGLLTTNKPRARDVNKRAEANKLDSQVGRLRDLGGVLGIINHQGKTSEIYQFPPPNTTRRYVHSDSLKPFDCGSSSKAWAQVYLYAVELMHGGAVGFGSDFNGFAGQIAPRFDPGDDVVGVGPPTDACGDDEDSSGDQRPRVTYPFQLYDGSAKMDRSVAGSRVFDFNVDGLAHIGMVPDFIDDLERIGVAHEDLRPLFSSAEAYVSMWEKAEDKRPVALAKDVTVSADASCRGQASIDNGSSDPEGDPITLRQSPAGPYPVGSTKVTLTVTDCVGSSSVAGATVTVVDVTPPTAICAGDQVVLAASPSGAAFSYPVPTAADNCPGTTVECSKPSGSTFAIGTTTVQCTARDASGNQSTCSFTVHVKGASEQLTDLVSLVEGLAIEHGVDNALQAKLAAALSSLAAGQPAEACSELQAFLNQVAAQNGKKLTATQATTLDDAARRIMSVIGCSSLTIATGLHGAEPTATIPPLPTDVELLPAGPSPFGTSTSIGFALPRPCSARLDVYDMAGRRVTTLVDGWQAAGRWQVTWNGTNQQGTRVTGGIYLCRLEAGGVVRSQRIVLLP